MTTPESISPRPILDAGDALALVRSVRDPSPLEPAPSGLSAGLRVLLKREDLAPNGSFKWRGALCALSHLSAADAEAVVTASTGNHGAATAWAASMVGIDAHVVVPADASGLKCSLIERNGAELHRSGADLDGAVEHARELAARIGAPYFEDGASMPQLLGTATIGTELAHAGVRTVITPLAVGALAGGIGMGLAGAGSDAHLYGVQVAGYDAVARALRGEPGHPRPNPTFADGLADNRIVEPAFSACRDHLSGVVVVEDGLLARAVVELHRERGILVEGAGAAALAGLQALKLDPASEPVALVVSGANLDREVGRQLLAASVTEPDQ